jgi:RimJ/RimL family protein N-acetyltransferase
VTSGAITANRVVMDTGSRAGTVAVPSKQSSRRAVIVELSVKSTGTSPALRLRPWLCDDADALVSAHQDPLLRRWLGKPINDRAEALQWIQEQDRGWRNGNRSSFAVLRDRDDESDHLIGNVAMSNGSDFCVDAADMGYWTAAQARGSAIAPHALDAVSRWATGTQTVMPAIRLDLIHSVPNHASCRVAEKCGFALRRVVPPHPPAHPTDGHLHVREREAN